MIKRVNSSQNITILNVYAPITKCQYTCNKKYETEGEMRGKKTYVMIWNFKTVFIN